MEVFLRRAIYIAPKHDMRRQIHHARSAGDVVTHGIQTVDGRYLHLNHEIELTANRRNPPHFGIPCQEIEHSNRRCASKGYQKKGSNRIALELPYIRAIAAYDAVAF